MMSHFGIKRGKTGGFTLLELMIVVAIVAILAAIAYPSYMDSVRKSNRSDAKAALNDAAQRMQRCYTLNNTFTGCAAIGASTSPEEFCTITVASASATEFTATATPARSPQTGDSDCTTMTLNHLGQRTSAPDTDNCW